jgi:hypothetical protein
MLSSTNRGENMDMDAVKNNIDREMAILTEGLRVLEALGGKQAGLWRKMSGQALRLEVDRMNSLAG